MTIGPVTLNFWDPSRASLIENRIQIPMILIVGKQILIDF